MEFGAPIFTQKDLKTEARKIPPSRISPSSIPFSWEQQPGIPKLNIRNPATTQSDPLLPPPPPPPPPLRPAPVVPCQDHFGSDPFTHALAECTKSKRHPAIFGGGNVPVAEVGRRRGRKVVGHTSVIGLMDLFGSCKTAACSVSESTVYVPRSNVGYPPLNGRAGYNYG